MSPVYEVSLSARGNAVVEITADDEDAAISAALFQVARDGLDGDVLEWEVEGAEEVEGAPESPSDTKGA
jgi:hypothetical protein